MKCLLLLLAVALSGCASTRDAYNDYRESHEVVAAFEVRGGLAWLGIGVRKVGRDAEIVIKEAQAVPLLSGK